MTDLLPVDPSPSTEEPSAHGADRLDKRLERMRRPDRAIPLPKDHDDDGVGPVTGIVP